MTGGGLLRHLESKCHWQGEFAEVEKVMGIGDFDYSQLPNWLESGGLGAAAEG